MIHSDLESLATQARPKIKAFLDKLKANNVSYVVIETKRDVDVQRAYYAQGRQPLAAVNELRKAAGLHLISEAENANKITECDGITHKSKHQFGKAIDVAPADKTGRPLWNAPTAAWEQIGVIAENCGLVWGGRWKDLPDSPHIEAT